MPVKVIALRLLIKRWLRKRSTKATEQGRARFVICMTGSEGNIDPDENPLATDDANTPSHDGLAAPMSTPATISRNEIIAPPATTLMAGRSPISSSLAAQPDGCA